MNEKDLLGIYGSIKPMIDREIDARTQSALRMKSMVVTTPYDSGTQTVGVTEAFGNELQLPVFGGLDTSLLIKGVPVWVMMPYGSMSNAVVFTLGDMTGLGGGGQDTNTTYTFGSGTTNGAFNVTPSDTGTTQSVSIYGLGSAAYTSSADYATAGSVSPIGTVYTGSNTSGMSVATGGSGSTLCSIASVPAGKYVVDASVRWASNSSGSRAITITTGSSDNPSGRYDGATQQNATAGNFIQHVTNIFNLSATSTFYLRVFQSSGSALTGVVGIMRAVRIK